MIFAYMDPALHTNLGHHANSCRHITAETRGRGIPTPVLSYVGIDDNLRQELGATPWFRYSTYGQYSQDPVCGWLFNYEVTAQGTLEDLNRLQGFSPNDVVFMNSVMPAQFRAMILWATSMPLAERPKVIMEFGTDPGVEIKQSINGEPDFQPRDPRSDARAILYRHASSLLSLKDQATIQLITFDVQSSAMYKSLIKGYPVNTLSLPHHAVTDCHSRVGKRPPLLSFLGHQRGEKGFAFVPAIVQKLLATFPDLQILVHNGWPDGMVAHQQMLRQMALADTRLKLNETPADAKLWANLLDFSDLIVCPYDPERFVASYSAIASEAIANAIPLVVPAQTTLAKIVEEFGGTGVAFERYNVDSIVESVSRAIQIYDELAMRANRAAKSWSASRGVKRLVDEMLEIVKTA